MNLPNSLTVLRIFFVPLLVVVLLTRQPNWNFWGLPVHFEVFGVMILLAAAATDAMDGYIARKRREVTTLGILLDPIADKLLITAAFVPLVWMHLVPAWMVVIILGREFVVVGLREIASAEGLIIPASALGKTKMILQVLAGCAVILTANHPGAADSGYRRCCGWWWPARRFPRFTIFKCSGARSTCACSNGAAVRHVMVEPKEKPQDVLTP